MNMRLADYVATTLADRGVKHVFMLSGGGAMFLNDAFGYEPRIKVICNHHEQACAMAAEGYSRIANTLGVLNVTTGPGGINAMTGVFGAWTDSLPMLVISGQVRRETCLATRPVPGLRQLGDQEAEIIRMVSPITKYAAVVCDPEDIAFHLDKAIYLATHARPGPCWLDIPIDVSASLVEPKALRRYIPDGDSLTWTAAQIEAHCDFIFARIAQSQRPVIFAGTGIRVGNALTEFQTFIRALGLPVVTAWTHDLIETSNPLYCGRPGTIGTRAGNFVVQSADLLLILGSRLNIRQTGYNWDSFAPNAYKIQVDIDPAELAKPTIRPDYAIHCDVRPLLSRLAGRLTAGENPKRPPHSWWLSWCQQRMLDYPTVLPQHRIWKGKINPYHFVEQLFLRLSPNEIVVCANAAACIVPFQAAQLKIGQRLFSNSGCASMGYDLPAAIGAYFGAVSARGAPQRIVCLAGDGSIQLNIQELQTIAYHQLPIKIFVLNNGGYLSIRTSQENFFGRQTGAGPGNGVGFPNWVRLAEAYGIAARALSEAAFEKDLQDFLDAPGPGLCEIVLDETQQFEPRMKSRQRADGTIESPVLEDMYPFLDRSELSGNLIPPRTPGASSDERK